jgi:hypothetical protein
MADKSEYLAALDKAGRAGLERRLVRRQSGECFICDEAVDLVLHDGQLDVDHREGTDWCEGEAMSSCLERFAAPRRLNHCARPSVRYR